MRLPKNFSNTSNLGITGVRVGTKFASATLALSLIFATSALAQDQAPPPGSTAGSTARPTTRSAAVPSTGAAANLPGSAIPGAIRATAPATRRADRALPRFPRGAGSRGVHLPPDQIVEADRWVQQNPNLKDQSLADAANNQPWDPSVKALCAFPSVLGNLDKNLSWTSSLGDAYYNQQQDVMDAIQFMRQKAHSSGALNNTSQQTVSTQGSNIVIQPTNPQVVYVPAYNPWSVYGYPVSPWPGWYNYPGIWYGGPYVNFGVGFGIGFWGGYGWGWGHWGFDWHNRWAVYGGNRYYSGSRSFYNRSAYYRNGGYNGRYGAAATRGAFNNHGVYAGNRGNAYNGAHGNTYAGAHGNAYGGANHGYAGATSHAFSDPHAARGYGQPNGSAGMHSGAFSGYNHGGSVRSYSSRGSTSVAHSSGGGGGHAGGGGGGHAGGGGAPRRWRRSSLKFEAEARRFPASRLSAFSAGSLFPAFAGRKPTQEVLRGERPMHSQEILSGASESVRSRRRMNRGAIFIMATLALGSAFSLAPMRAGAQETGQKTFLTADAAAQGLYDAISSNDEKRKCSKCSGRMLTK